MSVRRLVVLLSILLASAFIFAQTPSEPASAKPDPLTEGKTLLQLGEYSKAIQQFKDALAAEPKSGVAYAGLVRAYLKTGNLTEAYNKAKEGLLIAPDSPAVQVANADTLYRQGLIEAAWRGYAIAINSSGPNARAYLGLYRVHSAMSNHAKARAMIAAAFENDPTDSEILHYYLRTRKPVERVEIIEQAIASDNVDTRLRADRKEYLEYLTAQASEEAHPCKLAGDLRPVEVTLVNMFYDPKHLRGYGLDVKLNGKGNLMLLDTGASGLTINKGMAEKAGVKKLHDSKIGGIGDKGWRDAYVGYVDSIKIGDVEFKDCLVNVADRSVIDDGGLIGADVFSQFLVTINFTTERMKLRALPARPGAKDSVIALKGTGDEADEAGAQDSYKAPEMEDWSKFMRVNHDILLETHINQGTPKLFLLDTGAFGNTVSPSAAREVTKVHGNDEVEVRGISGKVAKVYRVDRAVLSFAGFRQINQDLVGFDLTGMSQNAGIEISGTLGFSMLKRLDVNIDYRDGLLKFNFDPNARERNYSVAPHPPE